MYDILRNLYQVSFFALILQFLTRLHQPFSVLIGLTFLYLAFAELFQPAEIDRLRRMTYISYQRKPDLTAAFLAMTITFGLYYVLIGFNIGLIPFWMRVIGTIGAIYIVIEPYVPRGGSRRPHMHNT